MEQITRYHNTYYYGSKMCQSADKAYSLFRNDYHESLGRISYGRLDKLGSRKERIHGYGFVFEGDFVPKWQDDKKTECRILGLVGLSYVRILGIWDYWSIPEENFDNWIDYVFCRDTHALKTVGLKLKTGRTSKRLNARYK